MVELDRVGVVRGDDEAPVVREVADRTPARADGDPDLDRGPRVRVELDVDRDPLADLRAPDRLHGGVVEEDLLADAAHVGRLLPEEVCRQGHRPSPTPRRSRPGGSRRRPS